MPKLFLYNTLTRRKEVFKPLKGKTVGLYTCGPTVYDFAHIGNLRTYLFEDVLKRTLLYNGYRVKHIENITDVGHLVSDADEGEDKMMKALKREGLTSTKQSLLKLADRYTAAFKHDLTLLNILPPGTWVKATDHVKAMVALIKRIEKNGYTYETGDGLYFNTAKLKDYGRLARLDSAGLKAGARVAMGSKKNPTDFALWIKAVEGNQHHVMQWPSPWGKGFPGWHIECSAMSLKYLGERFDIHCGGVDHIAVHHSKEIAQNEAATGKQRVNVWCHGEFLTIDQGRMGKSEGNFITLQTVVDRGFEPAAFRYLTLQTHYRQRLTFSWEALRAAANALQNLQEKISGHEKPKVGCAEYEEKFLNALNDDLNAPQALAVTWDLAKNQKFPLSAKKQTLLKFDRVLGLGLAQTETKAGRVPVEVTQLAEQRQQLRAAKAWAKADELRREIERQGYTVEDTAEGFSIKKTQ